MAEAQWNGTTQESRELVATILRYCTCTYGEAGEITNLCASHRALLQDQHWLNHVVFLRRISAHLLIEEWLCLTPPEEP